MSWLQRLVNTMRTGRVRRDIDRELAFHLAERVEQLRAAGLSAADAERQARLQFGNPAVQIGRTRDVDISAAVDAVFRNVRHAGRALRRTPGFTATAVLTLALGIGGNTAVFTAVDAVLLRPPAFPDADLVQIIQVVDGVGETGIAPSRLDDWNRLNTTFEGLTGHSPADAIDTRGPVPERLRRAIVAPRFPEVLGVLPASGRDFDAAEYLLQERIDAAYAQNRARTWILTLFAATALALVCAGVYGTLSYAISLRRREVALHLALGALRRTVIQRLVAASVRTTAAAAASGLLLALIFTQTLSAMLYGVSPFDPPTLAAVVAFVVGVALAAALVPAARATFVQPMRALRDE